MTTEQAIAIIHQVAAAFVGNRQDHKVVADAIAHLTAIIESVKQPQP